MKALKLILLIFLIASCAGRNNKKSIPVIDLQNPGESTVINLSQLLDDIRLVRLETGNDILLGENTSYLVGDKYIISIDNNKILQFSNKGDFLRTLATAGKGPAEFLRAEAFALDEKKDILYINHRGDSRHIISFDLKNGERINRIPTGVDNLILQIIVSDDSLLTIVPKLSNEYNLLTITTSGRFISGISPPIVRGIGLQTSIGFVNNNLFYMPKEFDTLYSVNNNSCSPYCFFSIDDRFTFDNNEIGNFVYLSVNAPGFMIANKVHSRIHLNSDGETLSMNADKQTRYFITKRDFAVSEIKDIYNDYLQIEENLEQWDNYLFTTNNLGYVCYSAFELKQKINKTLVSKKIDNPMKKRIVILDKQIKEDDNPILIIGKLK